MNSGRRVRQNAGQFMTGVGMPRGTIADLLAFLAVARESAVRSVRVARPFAAVASFNVQFAASSCRHYAERTLASAGQRD
jgi:hypothetical protein